MKPKTHYPLRDSNEQALSIRKILLETRGYRVVCCGRADQAMEHLRGGNVDLVMRIDSFRPRRTEVHRSGKGGIARTPCDPAFDRLKVFDYETKADVFLPRIPNRPPSSWPCEDASYTAARAQADGDTSAGAGLAPDAHYCETPEALDRRFGKIRRPAAERADPPASVDDSPGTPCSAPAWQEKQSSPKAAHRRQESTCPTEKW